MIVIRTPIKTMSRVWRQGGPLVSVIQGDVRMERD